KSNQATTSKGIYDNFILASDYATFDTDMLDDNLSTNLDDNLSTNSNLPKSPRNTLSNLDQNVQKKSNPNLESESLEPKQIQDQISREIGG
ncbi:6228_t:CDS:1, partial [Racocetra persica]